MAHSEQALIGNLLVLSQARRLNDTPSNFENDCLGSDSCRNKNCPFHRANKNSFIKVDDSHLDYKSGAIYDGGLKDNHKIGNGTFIWPNGDKYIGEYKLNCRHGYGNLF